MLAPTRRPKISRQRPSLLENYGGTKFVRYACYSAYRSNIIICVSMTSPVVRRFCEIDKAGGKFWKWYILGNMAQVPPWLWGHSSQGVESMRGAQKSPNNFISTFFSTVHFLPERPQDRPWGRQTCFLARASSNLVTPARISTWRVIFQSR